MLWGVDEYLAEAATDTLHKMHFWERVGLLKSFFCFLLLRFHRA